VAQHTCLVHGLEAFNRVSERLLELGDETAWRLPALIVHPKV
jgi:hypothetical protein